jgi:hypothetical protein
MSPESLTIALLAFLLVGAALGFFIGYVRGYDDALEHLDQVHRRQAAKERHPSSIQANDHTAGLRIAASALTAESESRTLSGLAIRYGVPGRTSAGLLRVRPGALKFPDDLTRVKLTKEHDREASRGYLATLTDTPDGIRMSFKASQGPEGDAALREALDKTRDGFSFDVVDAVVEGDEIVSATVVAVGQVGIPAYDDTRIDTVAANQTPAAPGEATTTTPPEGTDMTPEQIARLAELRAKDSLTQEEAAELATLVALEETTAAAEETTEDETPATVGATASAASIPAVPAGHRPGTVDTTSPYQAMLNRALDGWKRTGSLAQGITAALSDITNTAHVDKIEQPAWSGELWSGVQYEPVFSDLFTTGSLTSWKGTGWRFTNKLEMADYSGDKTAVPSDTVTTESSEYEAARLAIGVDIDRKFYDFPNAGFIDSLMKQIAESWTEKLDGKVRTYVTDEAVFATRTITIGKTNADATITAPAGSFSAADVGRKITGSGIPANATIASVTDSGSAELSANATNGTTVTATIESASTNLLKVVGRLVQAGKNTRIGSLTGVVVNDDDLFELLDVTEQDVPKWLALWGIDPQNFRSDASIARGTVYGVVKPAATLRTLSGSPIRVNAQNIALGGVDEAAFGYWAIEQHHPGGVLKAAFVPA